MIPAGTDIAFFPFDLHRYIIHLHKTHIIHSTFHTKHFYRDERFWVDPLKFDPDRFLPERFENQYQNTYVPFSAGLRNCIGNLHFFLLLFSLKLMKL